MAPRRGGVERPRLSPGPAGVVVSDLRLLAVRSAVVRGGHRARHHPRAQSHYRVRRQGSRRPTADARRPVSLQLHCYFPSTAARQHRNLLSSGGSTRSFRLSTRSVAWEQKKVLTSLANVNVLTRRHITHWLADVSTLWMEPAWFLLCCCLKLLLNVFWVARLD